CAVGRGLRGDGGLTPRCRQLRPGDPSRFATARSMSDPVPFLTAFGHALASMGLYGEGHPARQRAAMSSLEELTQLATADSTPQFTFVGGEVAYRRRVLRELPAWEWASRLAGIGIERLEFQDSV